MVESLSVDTMGNRLSEDRGPSPLMEPLSCLNDVAHLTAIPFFLSRSHFFKLDHKWYAGCAGEPSDR